MLSAAAQRIQLRAAAWAERRQGRDAHGTTLKRRRIYILPSRFGVIFGLLVFAMLLGSLNYSSSLGFALTFLLTGLGLVAMHHCHNNLLGTQLRFSGARPVFAGQHAEFRIALGNAAGAPRYELALERDRCTGGPVDLGPGETRVVDLSMPAEKRGRLALKRFSVSTRHPGNLFRAWAWMHMDAQCLVYPRLAAPGRALPPSVEGTGMQGRPDRGDSDFAGLRSAVPGDPPRRIAWKAYARNDELLVKQFASSDQEPRILDWDCLGDLDPEQRLSQLARWCVDAAAEGRSFGLHVPGKRVALGSGEHHLRECLTVLALFDRGGTR